MGVFLAIRARHIEKADNILCNLTKFSKGSLHLVIWILITLAGTAEHEKRTNHPAVKNEEGTCMSTPLTINSVETLQEALPIIRASQEAYGRCG